MVIFQLKKKLDLRGESHLPGIALRRRTFSRRSRKPPNPCPTHTQRHRTPVRTGPFLRLVLWREVYMLQQNSVLQHTWGFSKKSQMSVGQEGHVFTIFCALRVRPPRLLSLTEDWLSYFPSKQVLQKLWAHGVVSGSLITARQIEQPNSAGSGYTNKSWDHTFTATS